jgi:hypothetical protein
MQAGVYIKLRFCDCVGAWWAWLHRHCFQSIPALLGLNVWDLIANCVLDRVCISCLFIQHSNTLQHLHNSMEWDGIGDGMNFRNGVTAWIRIRSAVRWILASLATDLFVLGIDATDYIPRLGWGIRSDV